MDQEDVEIQRMPIPEMKNERGEREKVGREGGRGIDLSE